MEIFGIGAPELIFVIIIALIVLGPKDMQKAGRTIGRWLNQLVRSDGWKAFQQTSREIRNLPNNLMRQANMELAETEKEIRKATDFRIPPASAPSRVTSQPKKAENSAKNEPVPATPPETQTDSKSNGGDSVESNVVENSIAPPPEDSPTTQADTALAPEDHVESNETEHSTSSGPPSADLTDSSSTNEQDAEENVEKKPNVSTTDQNA